MQVTLCDPYLSALEAFAWTRYTNRRLLYFTLRRVRRLLDTESIKTFVYAFVTSCVDYCNSVLSSASKVMEKVQFVQNAPARLLTRTRKYERGLSDA